MARKPVYDERQHSLFKPDSDWVRPACLPTLPDGALVAIDSETCDRGLQRGHGPGWNNPEGGWLCGVSWAWAGGSGYMPTRHPDSDCVDEAVVKAWVQDAVNRCDVVFQNATYDLGWTDARPLEGVGDTHTMAVLLDENKFDYSLDAICRDLGIAGKDEQLLREAVEAHGGNPKKIKEFLWKLPAQYVGPYAEQDAVATLEAADRMLPMMAVQGLGEAYELECDLIPYVLEMRRRGIRVNVDRAEENQEKLRKFALGKLTELTRITGHRRLITINDVRSPRFLETLFQDNNLSYPRTAKTEKNPEGNASFEKEYLERMANPIGPLIASARGLHDGAEKFIGNYIMDHLERGRLHAEIHQLRDAGDEGSSGTKTYRFSYSNPPLQQMNRAEPDKATPGHKDFVPGFIDIGTLIRECFEPEHGCVWNAPDYSQQEYRLIVHYAAAMDLPKSDEAVHYYHTDPKADYHNLVVSMTGLIRKKAKDANFAKAFGAGIPKFALMTGMSVEEAQEIMQTYDAKLPFVSMFAQRCSKSAEKRGYVRLMDGRRCRFEDWEASWIPKDEWERGRKDGHRMDACSMDEARRRQDNPDHPWHGKRLKRAGTHKAGNRVIQGGAAVQTKKALRACGREGFIPLIQMHDELCFSHNNKRDCDRTAEIMRDIVPLRVPVKVDDESGPDWGRAKYSFERAMQMVRAGAT